MFSSVLRKVAWVGRTASMVFGLALVLALLFGVASMAFAANGQSFILGSLNNTATALTKLTGNVNGAAMQIVNNNVDANDTALSLLVQAGEAPMTVNSAKKVANLNADRIDDREASSFANGVGGVATNADKLDGKDSVNLLPGGVPPSGTTIRGTYEFDGHAAAAGALVGGDSISFVYTLPSTPIVRFIQQGTTPPPECPGTSSSPKANPGYLCIYEISRFNMQAGYPTFYNQSPVGAAVYGYAAGSGEAYSGGTWAVTVPTASQAQSLPQQNSDASKRR